MTNIFLGDQWESINTRFIQLIGVKYKVVAGFEVGKGQSYFLLEPTLDLNGRD